MQDVGLAHETPVRVVLLDAAAAWTTLHVVPFHCSMRGEVVDETITEPTATQNEVVTHETLKRTASVPPGTVGTVTGDHVAPFHDCAKLSLKELFSPAPTAIQNTDVTHETAPSWEAALGVVVVFGMTDQFDALTCAGTVRP
jgi:hypothetical protein